MMELEDVDEFASATPDLVCGAMFEPIMVVREQVSL
jgi:hypothetical protein